MEQEKDEITLEIERMQNKILELEEIQKQKKKQKEIEEENSRKLPFENYFESLSEFITPFLIQNIQYLYFLKNT